MQLFVRSFESYTHNVSGQQESVADLKVMIASRDNLGLGDFQLYIGATCLDDTALLSTLPAGSLVDVEVPLMGGKVHGSLARAGKVRGQTPKVDKQEKKKKPTGRAKRRIQYNRRFVAVVNTVGRRRGPNAQSTA